MPRENEMPLTVGVAWRSANGFELVKYYATNGFTSAFVCFNTTRETYDSLEEVALFASVKHGLVFATTASRKITTLQELFLTK